MIVGKGRVKMDPTKIAAIRDWDTPTKKKELQRFLGFCNYYHRFIKDYSLLAKPLTTLTGNIEWQWTENEHLAFEHLIYAITSEPVRKDNFVSKQTHLIMLLGQYYHNFRTDVGILSHSYQKLYRKPNITMKFMIRRCSP